MKKHHWNGSLITAARQSPSSSAANGLFNLVSQQVFKSASKWPATVGIPYVTSGLNLYLDAGDSSSYVNYSTSGTTWSDITANNNDATLTNMAATAHTSSNGGYFTFDGTNDYVDGVNSSTTNVTGSITVECLFRVSTASTDWVRLFGKGDTNTRTYGLWYNSSNNYFLWQRYANGPNVSLVYSLSVPLDTWHYLVGVSDGTTHTLYLNNQQVATTTSSSSSFNSSTDPYTVGYGTMHTYHAGDISMIRLYNRALTSTERTTNYNNEKGRWDGSIVTTDLILHLDAGDLDSYSGTGTTWTDLSGNNYDGTLVNGTSYDGANQGSLAFDGSNDYVTTSALSDSFLQGNWTISFWAKFDVLSTTGSGSTDEILLHHGSNSNNNGMHLVQRDAKILFGLYSNDIITTSTVSANTWYHFTFTLNNTNYAKQIFINGYHDTSGTGSAAYGGTGSNARIGGKVLSFGTYLSGDIANVVAYDRVLSNAEILQNYNAFKDRYGHESVVTEGLALHLDAAHPDSYSGSGTTWYDLTSNDLDFTLQNGPVHNSSLGGYFVFDGTNDKAELSSGWTSFDSDPFTIEVWYRVHTVAEFESILTTTTGGTASFQIDFASNNGPIRFNTPDNELSATSATNVANVWKQVVFVREGTGTNQFKIYLNGSLDTTSTIATNFTNDSQLAIARNRANNQSYDGDISVVRIYKNKGLTSSEVTQNYDAVKGRYGLS